MKPEDRKKFDEIKNRVDDVFACHGQDIKEGKFLRMTAKVYEEMRWLVQQLSAALDSK